MSLHGIIPNLLVRQPRFRNAQRTLMPPQTRRTEPPNPALWHQTTCPMTMSHVGFLAASTACHKKVFRDGHRCVTGLPQPLIFGLYKTFLQRHLRRVSCTAALNRKSRRAQKINVSEDDFNSLSQIFTRKNLTHF